MAAPNQGVQIGAGIVRNLTQAQLIAQNYVWPISAIIVESDTGAMKFGDGVTGYATLSYGETASETLIAAGALSVVVPVSKLALVGTGAVTLAAPSVGMIGRTKTIQMTVDNGDVTLALTNVVGQSSGTSCAFNDVGDALVLIGGASGKWIVTKEFGVTLS